MKIRVLRLTAAFGVLAIIATACNYAYGPFIVRADAPVVMTAADLGVATMGLDPGRAVGYRWNTTTATWVQIPVQIDERVVVDFGGQPSNNNQAGTVGTVYGTTAIGVTHLQYADPGTWVGADPDATFDANDELVFMARDAGGKAPAGTPAPAGTNAIGKTVELADADGGTSGWVYLFYGNIGSDPSAGQDLVDYSFVLDGGTYLSNYKRADGPNPESSSVTTDFYSVGFGDRWITDELTLTSGTGVDILDGYKSRFSFSTCTRSNITFADAEGAFVANIDGPVRAIRSYIGANSGPLTQRTEIFYDSRYETISDLRVHAISGIMSYADLSAAAIGMQYGSSELASPVTVDGTPDTVPSSVADWTYVAGSQGNISSTYSLSSSASLSTSQVYVDDDTPPFSECWGDGDFLGASGVQITTAIPNTDPRFSPSATFVSHEVTGVWPTALNSAVWTPLWAADALQPLATTVTDF